MGVVLSATKTRYPEENNKRPDVERGPQGISLDKGRCILIHLDVSALKQDSFIPLKR